MKKLFALAIVALLSASTAAYAADASSSSSSTAPGATSGGGGHQHRDFATVKAYRTEQLQKKLACVQAANDFPALHACLPGGHGHWHHAGKASSAAPATASPANSQ